MATPPTLSEVLAFAELVEATYADFGGHEAAMKELREKVFKDRKVKTLQPAPSGEGMAVVEW